MKRIIKITNGLLLLISFATLGQQKDYGVGFKIVATYDSTRIYKQNSTTSDKLHYRPINIDVWYPADISSSDTTTSFKDLISLLEQRGNFYDDTRNYDGLTEEILQYICVGINCKDSSIIGKVKTNSYANAKSIERQFPLIVYLAGFNGMSYENYMLFEALTKKGFIVASVGSIGRYPGEMTMESDDILEQIKDAEFTISYLAKKNLTSPDIGLVGYSWGGLAATIMAMGKMDRIKAVVSLDGSEQFVYGEEDNETLTRIREADFFKPETISSPFLYLDSDLTEWDNLPDSVYNITDYIPGDKCYLKIDHSKHDDFSCLSIVSRERQSETKYYLIQQLAIDYLMDKLKGEGDFYKNIPSEGITKHFSQPTSIVGKESMDKRIMKGLIRDKKSNLPLPYVNIGILSKDVGTISNKKGEFELALLESNLNDTARISMIGYETRVIYLKDVFERQKLDLDILLEEKISELREVVVTDRKFTTRVLGNKTASKFFGGKFASGDLGSEIAIRIRIKDSPTYLDAFSFNISYNTSETTTFRLNIYDINGGLPDKNILTENIIVRVAGGTGKIDIDLSKYYVVVDDDFFIGLEWIEGKSNSGVVFSAGFANKGTYYRKASQGRWNKYPMGVGFNVTAKY